MLNAHKFSLLLWSLLLPWTGGSMAAVHSGFVEKKIEKFSDLPSSASSFK